MPKTYEPIATTTLGTATNTVTFTSIPGTYTDLFVSIAPIGTADLQINMNVNNDTGTYYSYTILGGNGTSAVSDRVTNATFFGTDYYFSTTTAGGAVLVNLFNYANTTTYKTFLSRANNAGKGVTASVGLYRGTNAITRLDFKTTSSTFAAGSTFTIYGIKAF
jgi:hypothetical protein